MISLSRARHFWRYDLRLVGRDRFLTFVPPYLVVIVLAMRWGVPPLVRWLASEHDFHLRPYLPQVGSYVTVLLSSMFVGLLVGFLLLDEKEQGTLSARRVTPAPLEDFLVYRLGLPTLFGAVALPPIALGHGLDAPSWPVLLFLALANAPMAAAAAAFFPLVAADKVQAFAWGKALSALCFLPLVGTLLETPWNLVAAGWLPPYWTVEAYVRAAQGEPWLLHGLVGGISSWALAAWTFHLYGRSVRRS